MNDKAVRTLRRAGVRTKHAQRMVLRAYPTHRDRGLLRALADAATPGNAGRLRHAAVAWVDGNAIKVARETRRAADLAASHRDDRRRTRRLARRQAKRLAYLDSLAATAEAARLAQWDAGSPWKP